MLYGTELYANTNAHHSYVLSAILQMSYVNAFSCARFSAGYKLLDTLTYLLTYLLTY